MIREFPPVSILGHETHTNTGLLPGDPTTATPTPSEASPVGTTCESEGATESFEGTALVCTKDQAGALIWLAESDSKRVVAQLVALKAQAEKAAAEKAAAAKAAAIQKQAAAQKAAEAKAAAEAQQAADQAAVAQRAADQAAAAQQAADQAAAAQQNTSGATALCVDGTLSFSATHRGTCSHHGGVSVWYK
ncbi:DUF3761 domain-containing protein [Paenarthrobacter sp. DKR-5]|nr:DUF3761 domain-containing protein [Paenarthrobacter sp. DKR-5]